MNIIETKKQITPEVCSKIVTSTPCCPVDALHRVESIRHSYHQTTKENPV
ncbi:hypothetical protein [Methanolobus sp.]|nr:hypothetical protein [Methanolobus sp.]